MNRVRAPHEPRLAPYRTDPRENPWKGVPASRYALWNKVTERWHFFQVDQPTEGRWAGYTFLNELSGGNMVPIKKHDQGVKYGQVLRHISENPLGAAVDYGKQKGECGKCHTTLTDPDSIAAGIGPVCVKKF